MKALLLRDVNRVELVECPIPVPGPGELLIKTGASTICTSDLNDIRENPFGITLPMVIGHEGAGVVVATGPGKSSFRFGDRVATHPVHPCGQCAACCAGVRHLCQNMGHFGINMQGTFAEYYLVREDRARRVPNDMDFCLASLAEPVCVGLEALAQARLLPGQSLLIIGDGPFGLLIARLASAQGLGRVVIAGWEDFRLQYAGAALAVNTRHAADPTFLLREAADGLGYDAAILAVGTQEAVRQGMNCLKPKGRFVIFSAISGETLVDLFTLHVNELELIGACNDDDRLDRAVELLSDTALRLEELITHRFSFEEYAQAFSLAASGHTQAIKVSIVFE